MRSTKLSRLSYAFDLKRQRKLSVGSNCRRTGRRLGGASPPTFQRSMKRSAHSWKPNPRSKPRQRRSRHQRRRREIHRSGRSEMTPSPNLLQTAIDQAFMDLREGREAFQPQLTPHEVGVVTDVSTGVATVSGLPSVGFEELVKFPGGTAGHRLQCGRKRNWRRLLGDYQDLHAGDEVDAPAESWTLRSETVCWGGSSTRWAIRSTGKGHEYRPAYTGRASVTAHHGPRARRRAVADRPEGYRRARSCGARAARIDSGRSTDGQDGHRDRQHPEPAWAKCNLRLLRDRAARLSGREGCGQARPGRRNGLHRGGRRRRQRRSGPCLCHALCCHQHRGIFHGKRPRCAYRL